ncbi:MAG: guanylate kinase [Candidatus Peregrinibacteria bacterium Greene0416_19]|nr:MAG: guanylate kinase [Candidatus Peregrinibacteria bacterium Greene0416_19]
MSPAEQRGKLVLLIGPSGVGKSVILTMLRKNHPELRFPRSATTRARRAGEGDELYHFVTDAEFDRLLANGKFIETAIVHDQARYGTLVDEIIPSIQQGHVVVREVDVQGFDSIRGSPLFSGTGAPYRLQSIFILPENKEQLIGRITRRAPIAEKELERRMASMEKELGYARFCDHTVINPAGKLTQTYRQVEELILREDQGRSTGIH